MEGAWIVRTLHLGDLLVKHGALTPSQRDEILVAQKSRGGPFGAIAEEMFGVSPAAVERAWAEQYAAFAPHIDPRSYEINPRALEVISRRQAWQFKMLPVDLAGDEVVACTTQENLCRALKFAGWRLGHACQFVLADPGPLGEALLKFYPMAGVTPEMMSDVVMPG
jgi:hypothetical protein